MATKTKTKIIDGKEFYLHKSFKSKLDALGSKKRMQNTYSVRITEHKTKEGKRYSVWIS